MPLPFHFLQYKSPAVLVHANIQLSFWKHVEGLFTIYPKT